MSHSFHQFNKGSNLPIEFNLWSLDLECLRRNHHRAAANAANATNPPTTPPTIAGVFDLLLLAGAPSLFFSAMAVAEDRLGSLVRVIYTVSTLPELLWDVELGPVPTADEVIASADGEEVGVAEGFGATSGEVKGNSEVNAFTTSSISHQYSLA